MECDICSNYISSDPGLHCPACARVTLYPHRINYATTLLEKNSLARKVEDTVKVRQAEAGQQHEKSELEKAAKKLEYVTQIAEADEIRRRIDRIMQQNDILRERIAVYKRQISQQKSSMQARRTELVGKQTEFEKNKDVTLDSARKSIKTLNSRHNKQHKETVADRTYLCKEAARLAGLRRVPGTSPSSSDRDLYDYVIAKLTLPDLRDLNHANPHQLSAGLNSCVLLLHTVCLYLGVRLPAEVVAPHKDWPLPTIFSISSSYLSTDHERQAPFPYLMPTSPSASKILDKHTKGQPRPRPLFLDRKLVQLARDDASLYSLTVEGIALFAWDVAWLCRTQGVPVATDNWEEICSIGKNLWTLLVHAPDRTQAPPPVSQASPRTDAAVRRSSTTTKEAGSLAGHARTSAPPKFGSLSHGTSHSFLRSALGTPAYPATSFSSSSSSSTTTFSATDDAVSNWKFASPMRFIDKLKAALLNDMSGLEWEMLDGEGGGFEEDMQAGMGALQARQQGPGTSGWTKLKSRAMSPLASSAQAS